MTKDDGGFRSEGGTSDEVRVAELLTSLADDPGAPPSTVTALSVIAAARAAAASKADDPIAPTDPVAPTDPARDTFPAAADEQARSADVVELRPRRRRFALAGLVAAASLAGISALVISLSVTGGSSTSTSADGARAVSAETAGSVESAAAAAPAPPAASSAAPFAADSAAAPEAAGQADGAGGAKDNSAAAAGSAAGGSVAGGSATGGSAAAGSGPAGDTTAVGCWPGLSDQALTALTGALPPGAFGSPQPLTADCAPAPVGGAVVPGTSPGTALVVRVSAAVPGACLSDTSIGTACVARGADVYQADDESGSPVVFAYGAGKQVVVSGWSGAGDSVSLPSGLTVEQSAAVAEAVLAALA